MKKHFVIFVIIFLVTIGYATLETTQNYIDKKMKKTN